VGGVQKGQNIDYVIFEQSLNKLLLVILVLGRWKIVLGGEFSCEVENCSGGRIFWGIKHLKVVNVPGLASSKGRK
jgi:hypothetical protein